MHRKYCLKGYFETIISATFAIFQYLDRVESIVISGKGNFINSDQLSKLCVRMLDIWEFSELCSATFRAIKREFLFHIPNSPSLSENKQH